MKHVPLLANLYPPIKSFGDIFDRYIYQSFCTINPLDAAQMKKALVLLSLFYLAHSLFSCRKVEEQEVTTNTVSINSLPTSVANYIQDNYPEYYISVVYEKEHYYLLTCYEVLLRPNNEYEVHESLGLVFSHKGNLQPGEVVGFLPDNLIYYFDYPIQIRLRHETFIRPCPDVDQLSIFRLQSQEYGFEYHYPIYYTHKGARRKMDNFEDLKKGYRLLDSDAYK